MTNLQYCKVTIFALEMMRFFKILSLIAVVLILALGACKSKGPHNPYLKMKTKPSEQLQRENKKVIKKGNRQFKRQEGKNRKHLFGRKKPPKA